MITINRIQYFLFAIILLGMFASFAQNDYSSVLLSYPYLFIGLLFLIETILLFRIYQEEKSLTTHALFESLALGVFFLGAFYTTMHWKGAVFIIVGGSLVLFTLYLVYGLKSLSEYFKNENRIAYMFFCLTLCTCFAILAFIFHVHNWAFAKYLIVLSSVLFFIFLLLAVFNMQFKQGMEKISFRHCLRQIKYKLLLSYVFFSFWAIYFTLVSFGIAPRLYSIANPPALEKMYQEQNPAAETYRKYYQQFLDNREASSNSQQVNLNSNK